jgi:hypothetical protein
MGDYAWDVLVYHDFSSSERPRIGEQFPGFPEDHGVVAIGPPIHEARTATVVLAFGARPMPEVERVLRVRRVDRRELRERLAQSSHDTYERHYRESGRPEADMVAEVNEHDYDRADAAIAVLEELGVWSDPADRAS